MSNRGFFITLEGGEGSGKSTQVENLKNYLNEKGVEFVFTREPGGTTIGEEIRNILLHSTEQISPLTELYLFNSARAELCKTIIKPALLNNKLVFSDRFFDSTIAYQGNARGLNLDLVSSVCLNAVDGCVPDLTIWLDITPEDAFKRKGGAEANDRMEQAGLEFHKKVYDGYLYCQKHFPQRFFRVDATKSKEEVFNEILNIIKKTTASYNIDLSL